MAAVPTPPFEGPFNADPLALGWEARDGHDLNPFFGFDLAPDYDTAPDFHAPDSTKPCVFRPHRDRLMGDYVSASTALVIGVSSNNGCSGLSPIRFGTQIATASPQSSPVPGDAEVERGQAS